MSRRVTAAALALASAILAGGILPAETSGPYRGPNNAGIFPAENLAETWPEEGPPLLWKYDIGVGFAGATVADGRVYVAGGETSYLYVFSLDGELVTRIPVGGAGWKRFSGTRSTPLVVGDTVVTTTPNANIYGIDLARETIRWKKNAWKDFGSGEGSMGWGLPSSPMLAGDKVVFNACSRNDDTPPIVAVDVHSGETVWEADPETGRKFSAADVSGAAFVHNGRRIVAYPCWRSFLVLDAETGTKLWEFPDPKGSEKTLVPIYGEGYLLSMPHGKISRMVRLSPDGSGCEPLWQRPYRGSYSQAVIMDGRVYLFGSTKDKTTPLPRPPSEKEESDRKKRRIPKNKVDAILCLDAATGQVIDSLPAGRPGHIIAADGMIYAVELLTPETRKRAHRPRVWLIRPTREGMEVAGRFVPDLSEAEVSVKEVEWQAAACPVIAEGRLFLRYGPLLAYELRADEMAKIRKQKQRIADIADDLDADKAARRIAALKELKAMGWKARPAAEKIAGHLDDANAKARQLAAEILGEVGPAAAPLLVKEMRSERVWNDGYAAKALVKALEAESTADALVACAGTSRGMREHVKALLPKLRAEGVPGLVHLMKTGDKYLRWWTIETVREIGPDAAGAVDELIHVSKTYDQWFRELTARTLGEMGPKAANAAPALVDLLDHPYDKTRIAAAEALGKIGVSTPEVLKALEAATGDKSEKVAEAARASLDELGG